MKKKCNQQLVLYSREIQQHRKVFLWNLSAFLLRSAFSRFVGGHLKALNHLSFYSAFASLVQLRLFLTSQFWAVWRKASTHRGVTSCSSSVGLLRPLFCSKSFLVYIIFRMPTKSSWSHLPPTYRTWTRLLFWVPPTQIIRHFCWRHTCDRFALETAAYTVTLPTQLMLLN